MNKPTIYFQGTRPEVADFLPDYHSKILEIGCGEGDFNSNITQNCEYWGIEPDQDAAEIAAQKLHKVLLGSYQEVLEQLPEYYFDLIICNDVVEHMADYNAFFYTIKTKIRDNSYLIGSIPNVRCITNLIELLFKKDWNYTEEGILDNTHLRFFTEKSLRRIFNDNGFLIEELRGINQIKFRFTPLKKLAQNLLIPLFGKDTRFMQFGFRIKYVILT